MPRNAKTGKKGTGQAGEKPRSKLGPKSIVVLGMRRNARLVFSDSSQKPHRMIVGEGGAGFMERLLEASLPDEAVALSPHCKPDPNEEIFWLEDLNKSKSSEVESRKHEPCWFVHRSEATSGSLPDSIKLRFKQPWMGVLVVRNRDKSNVADIAGRLLEIWRGHQKERWTGLQSLVVVSELLPGPQSDGTSKTQFAEFSKALGFLVRGKSIRPRSFLVCNSSALRLAGYKIKEDASLSTIIEGAMAALRQGQELSPLGEFCSLFTHIVVRLRADAVLLIDVRSNVAKDGEFSFVARLVYALESNREDWALRGQFMRALDLILAACIIGKATKGGLLKASDLVKASKDAVRRMWRLLRKGYPGPHGNFSDWLKMAWKRVGKADPDSDPRIHSLQVPEAELDAKRDFSIIKLACLPKELDNLACSIGRNGCEKARFDENGGLKVNKDGTPKFPLKTFQLGKLETIDRREADELGAFLRRIMDYAKKPVESSPLCLAVFGAPGSGKSFAVKEIVNSLAKWKIGVAKDEKDRLQEFNVSQFTDLSDLANAMHRIRDIRLSGAVPVAIFDEFDAEFQGRPFGWLQCFLMPMQDGKFKEGHDVFRMGACILVFSGGINHSFEEFSSRQRDRGFCAAKGPDFISRLRGVYNVPSLNKDDDDTLGLWKFRRATLLHGILQKDDLKHLQFTDDDRLLNALLSIESFRHGARSMEAIIRMCTPNSEGKLDLSSLPPDEQLDLHVDALKFREKI